MSRDDAIARALYSFHGGAFRAQLARLVSMPTESQNPDRASTLRDYLDNGLSPSLEAMGFACRILAAGEWPFFFAERIERPSAPTVLGYGHGDVIRGLDDRWSDGLSPWLLSEREGRWYGRGVADNKGQHAINLFALRAVLETRGALGFNAKFLFEMGEEMGSPGLRAFCASAADMLRADVLIASDGPRLAADRPTIFLGLGAASPSISGSMRAKAASIRAIGAAFCRIRRSSWRTRSRASSDPPARFGLRNGCPKAFRTASVARLPIARSRAQRGRPRSTRLGASPDFPLPRRCLAGHPSPCSRWRADIRQRR